MSIIIEMWKKTKCVELERQYGLKMRSSEFIRKQFQ